MASPTSVNESRVKTGTLKLEGTGYTTAVPVWVEFQCQATSVRIVPSETAGDSLETVGGCISSSPGSTEYTLEVTAISDFLEESGLVGYSWVNTGTEKRFEWVPNGASPTEKWTGSVKVSAVPVGGEANTRLTESFTWTITQLHTPPALGDADVLGTTPTAAP
jgi:hypothetical protein